LLQRRGHRLNRDVLDNQLFRRRLRAGVALGILPGPPLGQLALSAFLKGLVEVVRDPVGRPPAGRFHGSGQPHHGRPKATRLHESRFRHQPPPVADDPGEHGQQRHGNARLVAANGPGTLADVAGQRVGQAVRGERHPRGRGDRPPAGSCRPGRVRRRPVGPLAARPLHFDRLFPEPLFAQPAGRLDSVAPAFEGRVQAEGVIAGRGLQRGRVAGEHIHPRQPAGRLAPPHGRAHPVGLAGPGEVSRLALNVVEAPAPARQVVARIGAGVEVVAGPVAAGRHRGRRPVLPRPLGRLRPLVKGRHFGEEQGQQVRRGAVSHSGWAPLQSLGTREQSRRIAGHTPNSQFRSVRRCIGQTGSNRGRANPPNR
jgi:hypothetical protein